MYGHQTKIVIVVGRCTHVLTVVIISNKISIQLNFICFFFLIFALLFAERVNELKSQIPDVDNIFMIHRRIGEGTFSTVFLTSLKYQEHVPAKNKRFFALKHLIPTSHPKRVAQELRCLKEIG